jgi:uncharacterized membrane protein YgcG
MKVFGRRKRARDAPTYWNGSVIERIQRDAGVDRDTAAAWFAEMLRFLDLVAESEQFLSPPRSVDVAWHAFILHTRDYEAYCRERYGRIIHHQPTGEPDPEAYRRAYARRSADRTPIDHAIWEPPPGLSGLPFGAAVGEADREAQGDSGTEARGGEPGAPGERDAGGGDFGGGDFGGGDFGGDSGSGESGGGGDSGGSSCGGSSCGGSSGGGSG